MVPRQPVRGFASLRPKARTSGLVIRELGGEVVLYDLERHRAHCLRDSAAVVWRRCDGQTSVGDMAAAIGEDRGATVGPRAVMAAVRRLERAHLLAEPVPRPVELSRRGRGEPRPRRSLLRGAAATGGLAVLSLLVPTPEAAAITCLPAGSCVQRGSCTDLQGNRCCSGSCRGGGQTCGTGGTSQTPQVCN